ncbi:3-oxoacyl-ACP synthase III family protein [Agromyces sp. NPDC056965]|uniref:3-oxoacyl-ACP synthase III family protein n=1 Tax=Agromyces sp. NPDC056965 TaxID=3345983 RepID=UPI003644DE05
MSKRWVYGPTKALGSVEIDVSTLLEAHGPVKPGFLDKTGFEQLFATADGETSVDLAVTAAVALDDTWWRDKIDGLIHVSSTGSLIAPGNAHLLHERLGLPRDIFLLDINDACTGFVRALVVADALIESGVVSSVLVIAADTYTKLYDESELKVSPLFSDGASAVIVSGSPLTDVPADIAASVWEIVASAFRSEGDKASELCITSTTDRDSGHLTMNGGAVFNFVLRNINSVLSDLGRDAKLVDGVPIDWYVHQGSRTVVNAAEKALGAERDSLFRAGGYGNVVQSSLPFQLADDPSEQELIGLLGFGVGLTMAGVLVRQSAV